MTNHEEELVKQVREKDERIKGLKKENKRLLEENNLIKGELFSKCLFCGKSPVTKHSLNGKHKNPFIPLCRDCHDLVEMHKQIIGKVKRLRKLEKHLELTKIIKGEKK